ncbi:formin-like protein 11 [Ipomoea triloba]|uniref:formin-like protein 11 n=1 Tax=Ipomoea triloba TaxID=35885 RepID=UPI00125E354B|nr:formin-like protein 11 [Ipomoea triloba]
MNDIWAQEMGDHAIFSIIMAFLLVSFFSAHLSNVDASLSNAHSAYHLPSLSPPPSPLIHPHSPPPSHNHNPSIPESPEAKKKKKKKGEGANRRVVSAVLISAGITCSLCAIGVLWGCQKFRTKRKNLVRALLVHCIEGETRGESSQKSVEKVGLVTLQLSETNFLKQDPETANAISNQTTHDYTLSEKSSPSSSSSEVGTGEIICVPHENIEAVNSDHHSSDDQSFHSICNSFSSDHTIRFSNASASSLCEIISQDVSKQPQTSVPSTIINSNSESTKLPPPPPPPLPRRITNSAKGGSPPPPPQPSQIPAPLGKDGTPLPKLKPLHWDKVRAAPECSTVWDKLKASSFEFDEEMIESLFGYSLQNPLKNEEVKCKSSSPSPSKHILEPKRIQNIAILSKALNATSEQVCEALLNGSGLCLQELEALVKMAPAKEEEAKLLNYKGDTNELASAERFVKAMLKVPFAFLRVEAMLFKETFEDEVFLLRRSFSTAEEACKELRSSQLFLKLLEAVLKTGNRMNNGTVRGGAKAFKLDALLKLSDIKGSDGKTTLLHFVLQEMTPPQLGSTNAHHHHHLVSAALSTELCNVKKAAALDLDSLISCVSNLSGGIANTQNLLVLLKDDDEDKFVDAMRAFLKHAERNLKELREDEHRALLGVRQITEYFHGDDVSKEESNNPLRIFVIVRDFLGMLDRV